MKTLTLSSGKFNNDTLVSNVFLDKYMGNSNGEFVKVYLYLLRCLGNIDISLSDIADKLNLTEKDVIRALKYWDKQKVLSVTLGPSNEPESISILPLEEDNTIAMQAATLTAIPSSQEDKEPKKPSYSPAQIRRLKEQEDIKELLFIVEQYLCKTLTSTEMGTVLYFYKDLGFSTDLIEYLVEYCVSNQHNSLRYMEKVALTWKEKGITSVADAKNSTVISNRRNLVVTRSFGIGDRTLTPIELDFINRWYDEYAFDGEIIEEACKRTILSLSKPNFSYADGILKKWKAANIHTLDDAKKADIGFKAKITVPVGTKPIPSTSNNRFNNFSQRTYNIADLERNLISNNR